MTDANLAARPPPVVAAGGLELDRDAAERALGDIDPAAVVDVVNAEMLRALRRRLGGARARPAATSPLSRSAAQGRCTRASSPTSSAPRPCSCRQRPGCSPRSGSLRATSGATASSPSSGPLGDAGELPSAGEASLRYRGPVVRARRSRSATTSRSASIRPTRSATATRIPGARSSSSPLRTSEIVPGPVFELAESAGRGRASVEGPRGSSWTARHAGCRRAGWA